MSAHAFLLASQVTVVSIRRVFHQLVYPVFRYLIQDDRSYYEMDKKESLQTTEKKQAADDSTSCTTETSGCKPLVANDPLQSNVHRLIQSAPVLKNVVYTG